MPTTTHSHASLPFLQHHNHHHPSPHSAPPSPSPSPLRRQPSNDRSKKDKPRRRRAPPLSPLPAYPAGLPHQMPAVSVPYLSSYSLSRSHDGPIHAVRPVSFPPHRHPHQHQHHHHPPRVHKSHLLQHTPPLEPQAMCRPQASFHDGLPCSTHRQVAAPDRIPQAIYLGIEVEVLETEERVRYGICTHDGSYTLDYYDEEIDVSHLHKTAEKVEYFENHIISKLKDYQASMNYKAHLIGLGLRVCNTMCFMKRGCSTMCIDYGRERIFRVYGSDAPSLSSRVWLELDAIPFVMKSRGRTLDERASTAVRQAVGSLSPQYPGNIPRVSLGYRNEVEVDRNSDIHMIDLEHYRAQCCDGTWHTVLAMADELRRRQIRVSFFNSTPQGGGVALMRHALLRMSHHLQVNVHWYVTTPSPEIFTITKRKFHNVLQGVAPPDVCLDESDKAKWLEWTKMNVERHWDDPDGPLMTSDVIVIDDPQVCGLIPWIRMLNPFAKIVYRSHIEIRADLIRDNPQGPQAQTWDLLWSAIKQADLFVSHPVENFVPDSVPMENVVMMPAATDPLDGLNKPLDAFDVTYYQQVFNRICYDQGGRRVDWNRPYITQVARFDPSKGIPDVLLAYRKLYEKYLEALKQKELTQIDEEGERDVDRVYESDDENEWEPDEVDSSVPRGGVASAGAGGSDSTGDNGWGHLHALLSMETSDFPQLIICGHGSVDDPDGTWVFEEAHSILGQEAYRDLWPHVTIVRIPPCDQILNVVLRGAVCALQLSHREGFEVKITEAISKGVPVVAYQAGGIPFQIRHGENGYLVPVGDTEAVATYLFDLCVDKLLRQRMSKCGKETMGEEFFTVHNWANWAYIWLKVLDKPRHPPTAEEVARVKKSAMAKHGAGAGAAGAAEAGAGGAGGADGGADASAGSRMATAAAQAAAADASPGAVEAATRTPAPAGKLENVKSPCNDLNQGEDGGGAGGVGVGGRGWSNNAESGSGDECGSGSESESEVEACLNIDGSRRVCTPQLHRPRKHPKDVLGGGVWVKELWRREYVEGEEGGMPRYKHLHGHHVKTHSEQTWSRNMSLLQSQIAPPPLLVEVEEGKEVGGAVVHACNEGGGSDGEGGYSTHLPRVVEKDLFALEKQK